MEKLNFPVFDKPLPRPRNLPMDAYLDFVALCLEVSRAGGGPDPSLEPERVNVPFRLK